MAYTQRLTEANLLPSVGSAGDSYDNALAETISGLDKAGVIWRQRSWSSASAVEMATLRWVDWFNNHRRFARIGYITPAEAQNLKPACYSIEPDYRWHILYECDSQGPSCERHGHHKAPAPVISNRTMA